MAERRGPRKGASASAAKTRKRARTTPAGESGHTGEEHARTVERVRELEADLATARTTIEELLCKFEATRAGVDNHPQREVATQSHDLRTDDCADEAGAQDLEVLLRQRTRALIESEKQLEFKNTELERLNEMKVEFISIATHELRTPLTSIVGYLDLLEEGRFGNMPKDMERPMASLRRNAHRLKRLVDEMLDVSRIDSGRVTLFRKLCDLRVIVREVVAELQSQAADKRQELSTTLGEPPEIFADVDKIRQIAFKVIANAIRHTPEGGVITVMLDTAPPERFAGSWARLRVRATGIMIPHDMRSRIFEPFSSPHKAKHHTSAGPDAAGLGLYIARGLIDLHGGLISVDSTEGEYTEFTVLLPRSEPSEPA